MSTVHDAADACRAVERAREDLRAAIAERDRLLGVLATTMPQRRIPAALAAVGITDGVSLANVRLALARARG